MHAAVAASGSEGGIGAQSPAHHPKVALSPAPKLKAPPTARGEPPAPLLQSETLPAPPLRAQSPAYRWATSPAPLELGPRPHIL